MDYSNKNYNKKLNATIQLINVFIGIILALLCVFAYMTIENIFIRIFIIALVLVLGVVCFINSYKRVNTPTYVEEVSKINEICFVNEDNEIINTWNIGDKISLVIGKSTEANEAFIDLSKSIFSRFIEENHAVLNYACGKWYVEDISINSEICIQKFEDKKRYRAAKNIPCELHKGDILFVDKVKLLLK